MCSARFFLVDFPRLPGLSVKCKASVPGDLIGEGRPEVAGGCGEIRLPRARARVSPRPSLRSSMGNPRRRRVPGRGGLVQ